MTLPPPSLREGPILLDYATTPVDPRVAEPSLPYLTEHFGNPSSGHAYGYAAHRHRRKHPTAPRASTSPICPSMPMISSTPNTSRWYSPTTWRDDALPGRARPSISNVPWARVCREWNHNDCR